jgi:diadenosine tetraphosphate (Ap4A) HIT family hydrolase
VSVEQCPFCSPSLDQLRVVAQNETSFVILSNPRMMEHHLLVLPKRHVWHPWEVSDAETQDIQKLITQMQQTLFERFSCGSDVRQQFRPFMEASRYHNIRHIHFHILPRQLNDELYRQTGQREPFEHVSEAVIKQNEDQLR